MLFAPSGAPDAYYAEFGWVAASGTTSPAAVPGPDTLWKQQGSGALSIEHPVTLTYDNGQGLVFTRTISIDDRYMFALKDSVANSGSSPVTMFPYGLISRHSTPETLGYYILHEGLIGVMGDKGEQTKTYKDMQKEKSLSWEVTDAWLGFTDKYFASVLFPTPTPRCTPASPRATSTARHYQTDYLGEPQTIAPARPAEPARGCSPAPRKSPSSASISRSAPAAITRSSTSTSSTS